MKKHTRILAVICIAVLTAGLLMSVCSATSSFNAKYEITLLNFHSASDVPLDALPNSLCLIHVGLISSNPSASDTLYLLTYGENGQFLSMQTQAIDGEETEQDLSFSLDNKNGEVAAVKAGVLSDKALSVAHAVCRRADGVYTEKPVTLVSWQNYCEFTSTRKSVFLACFENSQTYSAWRTAAQEAGRVETTEVDPSKPIDLSKK